MTLDTYADLFDKDLDGLRMAMDEALSGMSWNCLRGWVIFHIYKGQNDF